MAIAAISLNACKNSNEAPEKKESVVNTHFKWEAANVYFLLTDRFYNADPSNDLTLGRTAETASLRGFMGGDLKGILAKLREGYFRELGINAIWFTPVVEQIHDPVDEGTGNTYAYHGYWAKDWTTLDPNFGTQEDLKAVIEEAHRQGIRILLDVVMNHTGPVTEKDPFWGDQWARQQPQCTYDNYENTTSCTLVANLPDILTGSDEAVEIPEFLKAKWEAEGRLESEMAELDAFFATRNYPRAPRYYLIKWLTDYVRELGVDGFRVDTVKHTESFIWNELYQEASAALTEWRAKHPQDALDQEPFYMVGEVYNYGISGGRWFDYGDRKVDFFEDGFHSLINFDFKGHAQGDYEWLFSHYDSILHTTLSGKGVLNYLSSHDDGSPFDLKREKPLEAATKLLLSPGSSQVYYGDESARQLVVEGAQGDANLRSFMNWEAHSDPEIQKVMEHWQKLGRFRRDHVSVGAGRHEKMNDAPYTFRRTYTTTSYQDKVVIALDAPEGIKTITTGDTFADGTRVKDAYSGEEQTVSEGKVQLNTPFSIVLLEAL